MWDAGGTHTPTMSGQAISFIRKKETAKRCPKGTFLLLAYLAIIIPDSGRLKIGQKDLAKTVKETPKTIGKKLAALEEAGLIKRTPTHHSASNRRERDVISILHP
jgi:DNA-binding MarR family transcriptional regulator